MLYPKLKFPIVSGRPFFYTNFVQTVDGKVQVKVPGYWPIGSKIDYQVLTELRTYADCLIHGKNLYLEFGDITKKSLQKEEFKKLRKKLGKDPNLPFIVGTHDLKKLSSDLYKKGYKNVLVEGGPTLLGSFLKEDLIDEIFLTISPKIFGSEQGKTLTLVEGVLFPPNSTKKLKPLSIKPINDELFLRYSVEN
ncbi:MAG: bifunctional deaminase-reductase domain-containing protein [Microgenomates group bacterium Gr01-1014_7]|nr:MAG: bifunctional deaminase-reductase domain-containing protein [Microgenomates group bacterium Gr01-1014_7]